MEHHKILTQVTQPLLIERRRNSMANCGRMFLEIAQWSQRRAYRKPTSLFPMVRWAHTTSPSLKWGPKCSSCDMSNFEWPYLYNGSQNSIQFMCGSRVGFSGSPNSVISSLIKPKMVAETWQKMTRADRCSILPNYVGPCYCLSLRESMRHSVLTFVNFGLSSLTYTMS